MVLIYYLIEDGEVTNIYDPVEEGSGEQYNLTEFLASNCDDRTNYGCFEGFKHKNPILMREICKKFIEYVDNRVKNALLRN